MNVIFDWKTINQDNLKLIYTYYFFVVSVFSFTIVLEKNEG
jgi:hypothetical protein